MCSARIKKFLRWLNGLAPTAADVGDDNRGALLRRLESSSEVLSRLDERQRNEFARWVNDIAIVAARAEKEDGKRVSDKEEAALQRIRSIVHG